jgi:hypothetical protein
MINKWQEVNQAKKGMQQKSTERELGEDMYVKNGTGRLKKFFYLNLNMLIKQSKLMKLLKNGI